MSDPKPVTYHCVFKKGETRGPVAMFLYESDQQEWHLNPELFSNARRRVVTSERPLRIVHESAIDKARTEVIISAIRFSDSAADDCTKTLMDLDSAVAAYKALRRKGA